jgi:putative transposase
MKQCDDISALSRELDIYRRLLYRWRAVDQDCDVLGVLVQNRRDKKAAKKFSATYYQSCGMSRVIITDQAKELEQCES